MKKVSAIIVCCLLAVALIALPVLAAQSATTTVTADKTDVQPGDVVTVTISVSEVNNVRAGGIIIDFDSDVFTHESSRFLPSMKYLMENGEYVEDEYGDRITTFSTGIEGDATKCQPYFVSINKDGDNLLSYTVKGAVFELKLKVKETAPSGTHKITANLTLNAEDGEAACTEGSASVTLACDHQWGQWAPDGAQNHKQTCLKCGEPKTEGHKLGSYTVTTAAGCDKAGEKTATCSVCGYEDKQPVAATGNHSYGAWTKVDDTNHKRTCTDCQTAVETKAHTWNAGTVTTQPGCNTPGVLTKTCTGCNATKVEPVAATGKHIYGNWVKVDDQNHKRTCTDCQTAVETKAHTWNAGTVTKEPDCANPGVLTKTCTGCGATTTTPIPSTGAHGYGDWTMKDDKEHTRVCTGCGGAAQTESHTMDKGTVAKEATCKDTGVMAYKCTAKGCTYTYDKDIPTTDDHKWGDWTTDGTVNHKRTCSVCQKTETEAHKAGTELKSDAENHWYECLCGEKMNVTAHDYNKLVGDAEGHAEGCECGALKAGATKAPHNWDEGVVTLKPTSKKEGEKTFTCNVCGYKRVEAVDKVSTPNTGDNTLVIPMVILAVLSACGLAVTVVARKRASR